MAFLATIKEWLSKALALLDYIISILRVKLAFLKPLSPSDAPKWWIYINGTCCIGTAMFFMLGWMDDKSTGYQFCESYYIPFNLLICFIWFAEAGLWMLFDDDEESPAWHKLGELGLAVFFVGDSLLWLYGSWVLEEELKTGEILLYSAIDFFIYLFYLVLAIRSEAKVALAAIEEEANNSRANNTNDNAEKSVASIADTESGGVVATSSEKPDATTDFKLLT